MNKDIPEFAVCDFKPSKPKSLLGIRHVQVLMLFLAMLVILSTRINMSIAIVAMTDKNHEDSSNFQCDAKCLDSVKQLQKAKSVLLPIVMHLFLPCSVATSDISLAHPFVPLFAFDWTMQRQGVILSSFSWGYFICQIPAGELAARFGGSILITLIVACNAAVSLFIPLAAYYGGWQAVCACRVLQGLSQGFTYPVMHNLIGKWIPPEEKGRFATFIYAGAPLGDAIQLLASGFIIAFWGWPAVFYINGIVGAVWVVAYIMLGADSPQKSKRINDEERLYIQHSLDQVGKQKKLKTPWKALGTSLPFYALIIGQCGHSWGIFTINTEMPSYIKNILQVDIKANGAMSSLPYLAKFMLSFPFGFMSDYIIKKKWVSVTAARKISNTIGECVPAVALIGLSYMPAGNITLALALLTVVVGFNAAHYTGTLLVHIDMAPNHAGTMIGITNTCASIVSLIAPLAAGWILQNEGDPKQWNLVFYVSSAIYITANIFYVIFGTSKRQSWNKPEETDDEIEKKMEKAVQ